MHLIPALLLALAGSAWAQEYGTTIRLKMSIGGESRKAAVFLPKALRKNEVLPLLVALPGTNVKGKAMQEIGSWQQQAFEHRYAVLSVDLITATRKGWVASEQIEMTRDMEAITTGIDLAIAEAKKSGASIDQTATVMTGHSGATYVVLWLGLRRPDLFLGICGRSVVFHKETVKPGKLDKVPPNFDMPIYIFRGELDAAVCVKQTELANKTLRAAGYRNIEYRIIPKMPHESKPDIFQAWYYKLLKETAKGRKESRKIAVELAKLKEALEKGRGGTLGKLIKLVEKERKAGFPAGAEALLATIEADAKKQFAQAGKMEEIDELVDAVQMFKDVQKRFAGLPIAKDARTRASRILKSDAYKALEMLTKARRYREKGLDDKATALLEKIADKYPDTPSGEEAQRLLSAQ